MNKNTNSFVGFLDEYALQYKKTNDIDYSLLLSLTRQHYLQYQLFDASFVGVSKPSAAIQQPTIQQKIPIFYQDASMNLYYNEYSQSNWNKTSFDSASMLLYPSIWTAPSQNDYAFTLFKDSYLTSTMSSQPTVVSHLPKEYVHIDASMQNLKDILAILQQYPLETNPTTLKEYNIDLKSLHNIQSELQELENMIGMESLKQSVLEQLLYFVQELHIGQHTSEFKHTALFGSPGTGKTEIAKIIGRMYSKLGILKNNVFRKVTRNDLIAGYLGQTALKTKKVIDECLGGVLFIDEAYSLANGEGNDSYSKECIDTLCEALSDHKGDLMVIIAGYEQELNETFFKMNKGLPSRFIWRFTMDPYTPKELMQIFQKMVAEQEWTFLEETTEKWFHEKKDTFIHYGRDMELLLTYTKIAHGSRIYGKQKEIRKKISLEDMNRGYETLLKNRKLQKVPAFLYSMYS